MPETRATSTAMRAMLYVAGALVFGAGFSLNVMTESTDADFPITIDPPITAAFLGAAYWSACVVEVMSARRRVWAEARAAVPGVLAFTTITGILTYLGLDQVHLHHPSGWIWLATYTLVPPALAAVWLLQARQPGGDPPIRLRMPTWMVAGLWGFGMASSALGLAMIFAPLKAAEWWPWVITPPDARYRGIGGASLEPYIGAWLIGLGLVAVRAVREVDPHRLAPIFTGALVFAALQALTLTRYPGAVRWQSPAAWLCISALLLLAAVGLAGRRLLRPPTPPP